MAFGEGPRVAASRASKAITSAMIDLVEGKKKTLGYVTGHKEPPLSEATSRSRAENVIEMKTSSFRS